MKKHQLDQEVDTRSPSRRRRHTHQDAYNRFFKPTLRSYTSSTSQRLLDGFALLDAAKVSHPAEVITVQLPHEHLSRVQTEDLRYFSNLAVLKLPDNSLPIHQLAALPALVELDLMCNRVCGIENVDFKRLEILNLSFNRVNCEDIEKLAAGMPRLQSLDLSFNDLSQLPRDLSRFKALKTLILAGNRLNPIGLFPIFSSIPAIFKIDISRNSFYSLDSEEVNFRSFPYLEELNLSYNKVENPSFFHFTNQFPALEMLIVTGNPFALRGEVEELDLEMSRGNGALVVNEEKVLKKPVYPKLVAMVVRDYRGKQRESGDLSIRSESIPVTKGVFVTERSSGGVTWRKSRVKQVAALKWAN